MKLSIISTRTNPKPGSLITARSLKVELEGVDVTKHLRRIELLTPENGVVEAKIVLAVDEISVDADVLTTLQVLLPKPGAMDAPA